MNGEFFSGSSPASTNESARKVLADEIRAAHWPRVHIIRRQIAGWIENHRTPIDLLPLPARPLTIAEKCAAIAAFHDSVEEGEPFWSSQNEAGHTGEDNQSASIAQDTKDVPWWVLVSAAREIVPRPKDPLRTLLVDVVEAIAKDDSNSRWQLREQTRAAGQNALSENPIKTSMALTELSRIAEILRPYLRSQTPAIGLFSWFQELKGFAGEPHMTISLADAAGALGGEQQNIVWCGAATWRQSQPLRDEHGNVLKKPLIDPDGQPIVVDGHPMLVTHETPVEYRGVVVLDHGHSADRRFLPSALHIGFSGGIRTDLMEHMHTAGEVLGKIPGAIAKLWRDAAPFSDTQKDAGPLVLWVSAMLALHEQDNLIGDLIEPFRHWKVTGPQSCEFVKPGTDCRGIETSRRVAVVSDSVRASLQMIDWLTSFHSVPTPIVSKTKSLNSDNLARFKQLLVDDIFAQAWGIAEKLRSATNYSPETYNTFKPQWDRLRDGLNRAGEHLDRFPEAVRNAVEKLAAIVNEAASGISYADVCKSLAESQLELWSDVGWRGYKAAIDPPAIAWSHVTEPENVKSRTPANKTLGLVADGPERQQVLQSLKRVQERFRTGTEIHRTLSVLLVHHAQLCFPEPPDWPDAFEGKGNYRLNVRGGPASEPRQLVVENGQAAVAQQPGFDIDGKPNVPPDGRIAAIYLGGRRTYSLYGSPFPGSSEFDYSAACDEYMDAAAETGRIIDDLPIKVKQVIWRDWPHGFIKPDAPDLWTNAVFELAWQDHTGSGLAADRWTWLANKKLKIGDVVRTQAIPVAKLFADLIERAGDPPRYWYSWLSNIWAASIAALDIVASLIDATISDDPTAKLVTQGRGVLADYVQAVTEQTGRRADNTTNIEEFEHSIPSLDEGSADWASNKVTAKLLGLSSTRQLAKRRHKGQKMATAAGQFGVHDLFCCWRKRGNNQPMYYLPVMRQHSGQLAEIFPHNRL